MPHFFQPGKEKHIVATLWENLVLFAPRDTVAALYRTLGFKGGEEALDLCWSYEFQLGHQDRHVDLVLHARFPDRDEVVLAEAKAPGTPFDRKDKEPKGILDREQFTRVSDRRRYFLLGDGELPVQWLLGDHGVLRWEQLLTVQGALCDTMDENQQVRDVVRQLLIVQFGLHGIGATATPASVHDLERRVRAALASVRTPRVRGFIGSAIHHLRCLINEEPSVAEHEYLTSEPTVEQILPGWRPGCGRMAMNTEAHWQLPPRACGDPRP